MCSQTSGVPAGVVRGRPLVCYVVAILIAFASLYLLTRSSILIGDGEHFVSMSRVGDPSALHYGEPSHFLQVPLARAIWLAVFRGGANRVVNVADDGEQKMGDYFDQVATAVGLQKPPRLPRSQLMREVSPMLYSFMSESRRIDNTRLKRELRLRFKYPTPAALLREIKPAAALQRSLL